MKLLSVFLALLTLVLSVNPCCGNDDHCPEYGAIDNCEHSDEERGPSDEQGLCSPFYACGSCTGFTLNQAAIYLPLNESHRNVIPELYLELPAKEVFFPSFKPPRII